MVCVQWNCVTVSVTQFTLYYLPYRYSLVPLSFECITGLNPMCGLPRYL